MSLGGTPVLGFAYLIRHFGFVLPTAGKVRKTILDSISEFGGLVRLERGRSTRVLVSCPRLPGVDRCAEPRVP